MTEKIPSFTWQNFSTFIFELLDCDPESLEFHHSPRGTVESCKSTAAPFIGRFTSLLFRQGIGAVIVDGQATDDITFQVVDGDWVRFNFALSIDLSMDDIGQSVSDLTDPSWRLINHPPGKITRETLRKKTSAQWMTIICKMKFIQQMAGRAADDLPDLLHMQDARQKSMSVYRDFDLRSRFVSIASDILKTPTDDPIYISYLEARLIELLCLALKDLIDPVDCHAKPTMSAQETKRILHAKRFIDQRLHSTPSVKEVAAAAGLNRNSLFYGFKEKFGKSVSEYIQTQKLEHAKFLIEHSNRRLVDVAEAVGFRHESSFITAFRKQYGITPGKLRREP